METYIQNYGQYNTVVDGNIIDEAKWNMVYDGDVLDLEAKRNNEALYMNLTNDDILKLLEVPANNKTITERLENDLHHKLEVEPIIIEEIYEPIKKNSKKRCPNGSRRNKKTRLCHRNNTRKNTGKSVSKNVSKTANSKSSSYNKSTRKTHSKFSTRKTHKTKQRQDSNKVTPDFMKTIY